MPAFGTLVTNLTRTLLVGGTVVLVFALGVAGFAIWSRKRDGNARRHPR